jgi:DNA-binding response OmpR family regulator
MSILVADDDKKINQSICYELHKIGFVAEPVFTAAAAQKKIRKNHYEVIILDWIFKNEKMNGIDLINEILQKNNYIPILMLSGRTTLDCCLQGLNIGADFYLKKPFYMPELLARVQALVRGKKKFSQNSTTKNQPIKVGPITLDPNSYEVLVNHQSIILTPKEFKILKFLLERAGKNVLRSELIKKVWPYGNQDTSVNTLDVHIGMLRKKLKQEKADKMIQTIWNVGYRLSIP